MPVKIRALIVAVLIAIAAVLTAVAPSAIGHASSVTWNKHAAHVVVVVTWSKHATPDMVSWG